MLGTRDCKSGIREVRSYTVRYHACIGRISMPTYISTHGKCNVNSNQNDTGIPVKHLRPTPATTHATSPISRRGPQNCKWVLSVRKTVQFRSKQRATERRRIGDRKHGDDRHTRHVVSRASRDRRAGAIRHIRHTGQPPQKPARSVTFH